MSDLNNSLAAAAKEGRVGEVIALIEKGANVNKTTLNYTPLMRAAQHGHVGVIIKLIDLKADVNMRNEFHQTALTIAVLENQAEAVQLLLQHGANVDARDNLTHNKPPIIYASELGYTAMIPALVQYGANLESAIGSYQMTPLMFAASKGHIDTVQALVLAGANLNTRDRQQQTALHFAALEGQTGTVRELILLGANVNEVDKRRQTALMKAVQKKHLGTIKELIRLGADIEATDQDNLTAKDYDDHQRYYSMLKK